MALLPSEVWLSAKQGFPLLPSKSLTRKSSSFGEKKSASNEFNTEEKLASCLQTCSDIRSLRKLHACIITRGIGNRTHLASKLLNRYANISGLSESRCAFDRIINQNLSLWNSVMVGHFRAGNFEEILWLYMNLKLRGIGVDSTSVTFSLKSCIELGDVEFGRGIHVDAHKSGLYAGKFVGSFLVGLYSRCGNIEEAHQAFEEILDKDVVSYTSMVTGYARFSDSHVRRSFEIARDMLRGGLDANRVTLVSLLHAAGRLEALQEGRSIHCYALRRGISLSDEVLETSLVDMYARSGAATVAASMLRRSESGTVASWNAMITGLIDRGQTYEALKFFYLMVQEANLSPDSITLASVLAACSDMKFAYPVTTIHGYLIRRGTPLDLVATTVLIDTYSKFHKLKYAKKLFAQLMVRDLILYNVMISSYLHNGKVDKAVKMFSDMVVEGVRPNSATVLSLLSAFAELSEIRKGWSIHGFAIRFGLDSDLSVSNQILYMYAKCGCIEMAKKIFNSVSEKDLVSWTTMMMGYVDTGHPYEALSLFQLMQGERERPDSMTLTTVLQAISVLGCFERVKEIHAYIYRIRLARDGDTINSLIITYAKCGRLDTARNVFNSMVERRPTSWNTMIAAYGMHGYCKEVLEVFHRMRRENAKPDATTFTSLLSACSHGGLVEEGWHIFCSMDSEYSVPPQEEHYGCMVDLLGRAGQVEEAYDFAMSSPLRDRSSALCALLAACRIHGKTELGEAIGRQLLDLEPQNSRTYTMVSSIYAQASKWSESAIIRDLAGERGLRKMAGYSVIESDEQVFAM